MKINHKALKILAYFGQLAALFPFAVMFEAMAMGGWTAWHFAAVYGAWAAFLAFGVLIGTLINRAKNSTKLPKNLEPLWNFLLKIGFFVPTAVFIAAGVTLKLNPAIYPLILSAGIIAYLCAATTAGRSCFEIFTSFQFVLYLIAALIAVTSISLAKKSELMSLGSYMLCAGFAVIVLLTAIIFNQKNIDLCTRRRGNGKAVLPEGLRRYNALLVTGIFAVTLGLFVFAKPLSEMIKLLIFAVVRAWVFITEKISSCTPVPDMSETPSDDDAENTALMPHGGLENSGNVITVLGLIMLIIFAIAFRKHIVRAVKHLLTPLFKSRKHPWSMPFYDEITTSDTKTHTPRSLRKAERELFRRYSRERSPERKFRLGYALFLAKLRRTKRPPEVSDTVSAHREKGESEFRRELGGFSEAYSRVRYADVPPTERELLEQSELLRKIK